MTQPQAFGQNPQILKLVQLTVLTLENSNKFPDKLILNGLVDNQPVKFWLSTKQAGSLTRMSTWPKGHAVVDYGGDKPRFVWASDSSEWLQTAFLSKAGFHKGEATVSAKPAAAPATPAALRPGQLTERDWSEDDLGF